MIETEIQKAKLLTLSGLELCWGWELEKNMRLWLKNEWREIREN